MTKQANTTSQLLSVVIFLSTLLTTTQIFGEAPNEENFQRVQVLSIPAQKLNFEFSKFKASWVASERDWQNLWKHSRNEGDAMKLPVEWGHESLLAIFWESKDEVVRIPSLAYAEVNENNGVRELKLSFNLNKPCFGIITDVSPVQLVVVDSRLAKFDSVAVQTENTKSVGCF